MKDKHYIELDEKLKDIRDKETKQKRSWCADNWCVFILILLALIGKTMFFPTS
jgi:hypothetical protein